MLDSLKPIGFLLAGVGLLLFLIGALQVYSAKLLRRGAVQGGLYRIVRHPQYLALAILGLGTTLIWPRFLVLLSYLTMLFLYWLLARWEEAQCVQKFGDSYRDYKQRTGMILPRISSRRTPGPMDGDEHSLEEIQRVGGGHRTPDFDRDRYKVLFTQARLHAPDSHGIEIVKNAYGQDPILIVHVDLGTGSVLGHTDPPDHVVWGDIPTPMF